jgi:adenine deaminase
MLIPSEFAHMAVVHGTVATVSDPHEIANVMGVKGVEFMIDNGKKLPFRFYFGAPSCVPATTFETSGAILGASEIETLLQYNEIKYLAEMMNFPGVLYNDSEVIKKLNVARKLGKPIDGHAPGLRGEALKKYVNAGITTDHECFTIEEAREKIALGMKIQIREGSAARKFNTLIPLLAESPQSIMFCSDDKHPDDLLHGHMNLLISRAIKDGYNPIDAIRAASLNPITHYKLQPSLLQQGDDADFIVVDNLIDFNVLQTYIRGKLVAEKGKSLMKLVKEKPLNYFVAENITSEILAIPYTGNKARVIKAIDGEIVTGSSFAVPKIEGGMVVSDTDNDILKIVVINRYMKSPPGVGLIHGFGLKKGAIASTVAHDSHNLIAIGTDDQSLVKAINLLIETKGGICALDNDTEVILPLPFAGLMSDMDGWELASKYLILNQKAHELGSKLQAPFMTLSFMALLVIPELKISDKGLFDGNKFSFTDLFLNENSHF